MTVCICWCASSTYCCKLLVAKVMADAQRCAYSRHLSFLLSVRITHSQNHDRLSIPLTQDAADGKQRRGCLNGEMRMCWWELRRSQGGMGMGKWQQENWSSAKGFVLHFPDLAPEHSLYPSTEGRIPFIFISFLFESLAGYLYIHLWRRWYLRGEPWSASH